MKLTEDEIEQAAQALAMRALSKVRGGLWTWDDIPEREQKLLRARAAELAAMLKEPREDRDIFVLMVYDWLETGKPPAGLEFGP
jgi:hypothetical protein